MAVLLNEQVAGSGMTTFFCEHYNLETNNFFRDATGMKTFSVCDMWRRQQKMEQEKRDRELALRLAKEDQSQVEDLSR